MKFVTIFKILNRRDFVNQRLKSPKIIYFTQINVLVFKKNYKILAHRSDDAGFYRMNTKHQSTQYPITLFFYCYAKHLAKWALTHAKPYFISRQVVFNSVSEGGGSTSTNFCFTI